MALNTLNFRFKDLHADGWIDGYVIFMPLVAQVETELSSAVWAKCGNRLRMGFANIKLC